MKAKHKIALVAVLAAAMVLVVGIGYAVAQSGGSTTATTTGGAGQQGPKFINRGKRGPLVAGQVVKVENNTITIKTRKHGDKSVKVDDQTKYTKVGGKATLADVKPGEAAGILLKRPVDKNNLMARAVMIGRPGGCGQRVAGQVTAVSGDTVTIHTARGDKQVKIPPITNGERIGVEMGPNGQVRGIMYNLPAKPPKPGATGNAPQPPAGGQGT